jgi:hypothetical protein
MRPTTSTIFDTNLALLPSSLTARTSKRVGNRYVGSQWCSTTASCHGTRDMEAPSWVMAGPELRSAS